MTKKPPPEKDIKLTVRFPVDVIARLKSLAAAKNKSSTAILIEALADYEKKQPADLRRALDLIASESEKNNR